MSYDYATARAKILSLSGSYTLRKWEDMGVIFRSGDPTNITITVPGDLPEGFNCGFIMYGTGTITLASGNVAGAIATNRSGKTTLSGLYSAGSLFVAKNKDGRSAEFLVGNDFS